MRCSKTAVHNAIIKFNAGFMTGNGLVVQGRLRPGKTAHSDRSIVNRSPKSTCKKIRTILRLKCTGISSSTVYEKVMKRQILLPSLLWICLVSRLVCPALILYIILTNIFFPLGKMIGAVQSRTCFILSSRSWDIGSHPTGAAGRVKLS